MDLIAAGVFFYSKKKATDARKVKYKIKHHPSKQSMRKYNGSHQHLDINRSVATLLNNRNCFDIRKLIIQPHSMRILLAFPQTPRNIRKILLLAL